MCVCASALHNSTFRFWQQYNGVSCKWSMLAPIPPPPQRHRKVKINNKNYSYFFFIRRRPFFAGNILQRRRWNRFFNFLLLPLLVFVRLCTVYTVCMRHFKLDQQYYYELKIFGVNFVVVAAIVAALLCDALRRHALLDFFPISYLLNFGATLFGLDFVRCTTDGVTYTLAQPRTQSKSLPNKVSAMVKESARWSRGEDVGIPFVRAHEV